MADVNLYKKTSAPATANPNDIIFVKSGSLVSMYVCDSEGTPYGVIPSGDYVKKVNSLDGTVQLDLAFSGGVLSLTGSSATQNLDSRYFKTSDNLAWGQVSGTPTTIGGYGITDAYTKAQVDAVTGALANLQTTTKTNLVSAINELLTAINEGMRTPQPLDCSADPNYPASQAGDTYKVTAAGHIGGASGKLVQVNDQIICTATNGGGDQATVGASFFIIQGNVDSATTAVEGLGRIATQAEVNTGTEDKAWVTPDTLSTLLAASYYTAAEVDAKGYLTAEADTLESVTGRGNTSTKLIVSQSGNRHETTIGATTTQSFGTLIGGITIDSKTSVGGWAEGMVIVGDNSDASKKIGSAFGINGSNGNLNYAFWLVDDADVTNIYSGTKGVRMYSNGALWYGTPPANASAATKFLGLSSDGHTISTRTAAQVRDDIGANYTDYGLGSINGSPTGADLDNLVGATQFASFTPTDANQPANANSDRGAVLNMTRAGSPSDFQLAIDTVGNLFTRAKNSIWGEWIDWASKDWVNDQGFIGTETDPVWTAAKASATSITGAWTFTNGLTAYSKMTIGSAYGNEGLLVASGYSYYGMKKGSGNPIIAFNVNPTIGTDSWAQYNTATGSSAMQLDNLGNLVIYTAPANQTTGTFNDFFGTGKLIATQDWVNSQIPSTPTLDQVAQAGDIAYRKITIGNNSTTSILQLNAAASTGTGGYIQGSSASDVGYGVIISNNAYFDNANWVQPRGDLYSHILLVTHHHGFTWQYEDANGTNGATITPTEIASLGNGGDFTISGSLTAGNTAVLNGIKNATGNIVTIDSGNVLRYRTPAQILSDIGAQPSGSYLTSESDPVFLASPAHGIASGDITNWNAAYTAKHDALTLGTNKNGLSLAGQVLSLAAATTSAAGAMSASDKTKLNGIATGANNYSLPIATSAILGGVKIGSNMAVDGSGTLTMEWAEVEW